MSDDLRIETLGHDSLAVSQERTENGTGVTHLPECPYRVDHPRLPRNRGLICICDELRACQQRLIREGRTRGSGVWHDGYGMGYADALRDAVEAVKLSCSADIELVERTEVIAVIEALKEKP